MHAAIRLTMRLHCFCDIALHEIKHMFPLRVMIFRTLATTTVIEQNVRKDFLFGFWYAALYMIMVNGLLRFHMAFVSDDFAIDPFSLTLCVR